jgi:hypothetical protein
MIAMQDQVIHVYTTELSLSLGPGKEFANTVTKGGPITILGLILEPQSA